MDPKSLIQKREKKQFLDYLSIETQNATKEGAGFILEIDGNLWAGENIIPDDPNKQNQNGNLFENF